MFYEMDMKPDWKQELFNQERASVLEVKSAEPHPEKGT